MTKDLEEWQGRLERHFAQVASSRNISDHPLFALEHGLTPGELESIARVLPASLGIGRAGRYWLAWVVYATEFGYHYDGEEYWQSFEDHTPGWREHGNRSSMRAWFRKFQSTYHAVVPTGAWSEWFTIIAWPVTHAILPKYLQLQLARALFSLRYHLARLESLDALAVGQLLAASAWNSTSRFEIFLQQEDLVGRLVLALLSSKEKDERAPILGSTLRRIADDLERVRNAREWLRETRRIVADRFRGVARVTSKAISANTAPDNQPPVPGQTNSANIRPSVLLRRSESLSWTVCVEIGGFGALSRLNVGLHAFLRSVRCRIRGSVDTWMPAGWTLASSPRRVLRSWPGAIEPLLVFERPNPLLEHLLDGECRLSDGKYWLFRIGTDGVAREIVGRFVRCAQNYIILTATELGSDNEYISKCELACEGVFAYHLRVPNHLSEEAIAAFQRLGLQVARALKIWPVALVSRGWNEDGYSEWLTTEMPCFGILHDHPVESYTLQLDQDPPTTIAAKPPGTPTFVQLQGLAAGHHNLTATVSRTNGSSCAMVPQVEGVISVVVREPLPWVPGTTSHVGMTIAVNPSDPKLDEFWNEDVDISILGPAGYQVRCSLCFRSSNGEEVATREVGTFELPMVEGGFARRLHEFVRSDANARAYMAAASANLIVHGDELGEYSLQLPRDQVPIRWMAQIDRNEIRLRLIDDTGDDKPAFVCVYPFREPLNSQSVPGSIISGGLDCIPPGGLFKAAKGAHFDAIVVSSPQVKGGLQGLGLDIDNAIGNVGSVEILEHIGLWMKTRVVGPLAGLRRDKVVRVLCQTLYRQLCGQRWAQAEANFLDDPASTQFAEDLVESVDRWPGFAISIERDHGKTRAGSPERAKWFADLALSFRICPEATAAEAALRLTGQPQQLAEMKREPLEALVQSLSGCPVLLRGARLLALLDLAKRTGGAGNAIPRWACRS